MLTLFASICIDDSTNILLSNTIFGILNFNLKFDFIETIYTQLMHPATNILSPDIYNQLPYHDITSADMRKCENWFYNYGLSLAIAEFEKK